MAKIIKVGSQNLTPNKIVNPFKTSRNSTTNPFKYNDFEGNTLPFFSADVFEGTKTQSTSKLRMIASSVTGSMSKMRNSITEPIVNFVNRVRGGISSAWDYAKNTNISDVPAIKSFNTLMNTPIEIQALKGISDSLATVKSDITEGISTIGKGLTSRFESINTFMSQDITESWKSIISRISTRKINAEMSVAELEQLWKDELAIGCEVA